MASLRLQQFATRHVGPLGLSVGAAECVCVEGASGSGKTLLLRAIADLDRHFGEAYCDEAACSAMPAPVWRRSVALLVAESQWWSAIVGDHFEDGVDADWLARLDLPAAAMAWQVARCSTGERQRLALLRTLTQAPAVLLLDEPTGNLDEENTLRVESLLADYRLQRQAALLWVSHDKRQIERVAQRHFVLDHGQLHECGRR
ncbi:MAG TPA: ATP-binding cassette domain-containing protein [Candidatus Accumulibacter phosphatis]|nr:ATP-binding protein [Accumulibacter sp.]HCN69293.1 ATP-binding protein [Accumulibacter sp.]HCV14319.1 ATP-binding protein [Accumulibacter sp.]HRL77592.1 ATP-binding cassette domain-containing protein [Candidatus Accumulibacter phosphatis]HRQ97124.1 ATP-binding cassette domain-containing protein [Candidatus Accumulibacter phosphatis]